MSGTYSDIDTTDDREPMSHWDRAAELAEAETLAMTADELTRYVKAQKTALYLLESHDSLVRSYDRYFNR